MVSPPALVRVAVEGEAEKIGGAVHLQWLSWQPDLYPKRVAWNTRVGTHTHTHTHTHTWLCRTLSLREPYQSSRFCSLLPWVRLRPWTEPEEKAVWGRGRDGFPQGGVCFPRVLVWGACGVSLRCCPWYVWRMCLLSSPTASLAVRPHRTGIWEGDDY